METEEDLVARILAFGGTVRNKLGLSERLRQNTARPPSACNEVSGCHFEQLF